MSTLKSIPKIEAPAKQEMAIYNILKFIKMVLY
jgi:hypothetical protein